MSAVYKPLDFPGANLANFRIAVNTKNPYGQQKWLNIALLVGSLFAIGIIGTGITGYLAHQGMLPSSLASLNAIGTLGSIYSITLMAAGGLLSIGMLVGAVKNNSKQSYIPKNIVTIGTASNPLDETGISTALRAIQQLRVDKTLQLNQIDILVIHGNGNVELNTDPGFVQFNPNKIILDGARIVHKSCSSLFERLDEALVKKKEWLPSAVRIACDSYTSISVSQKVMSTLQEAMQHQPPSRGLFKGNYHMVYQVVKPKPHDE